MTAARKAGQVGIALKAPCGPVFAEVADPVGEVGAVEAVAGEAGGGPGEADAGVLDPARPAIGGVEVHAGDLAVVGAGVGEAAVEVVALERVADRDDGEHQGREAAEERRPRPAPLAQQPERRPGRATARKTTSEGEERERSRAEPVRTVGDEEDEHQDRQQAPLAPASSRKRGSGSRTIPASRAGMT